MLSKKAKYAIHAVLYLAKKEQSVPVLIQEISEKTHIPKKFLESILLDLKVAGILSSKKGKGGGYYLLKKTSEIHLTEIIRHTDGAIALLPCATHTYYEKCDECEDEITCSIRNVFMEVRNETVKMLKSSTIENLLHREKALKNLQ